MSAVDYKSKMTSGHSSGQYLDDLKVCQKLLKKEHSGLYFAFICKSSLVLSICCCLDKTFESIPSIPQRLTYYIKIIYSMNMLLGKSTNPDVHQVVPMP